MTLKFVVVLATHFSTTLKAVSQLFLSSLFLFFSTWTRALPFFFNTVFGVHRKAGSASYFFVQRQDRDKNQFRFAQKTTSTRKLNEHASLSGSNALVFCIMSSSALWHCASLASLCVLAMICTLHEPRQNKSFRLKLGRGLGWWTCCLICIVCSVCDDQNTESIVDLSCQGLNVLNTKVTPLPRFNMLQ